MDTFKVNVNSWHYHLVTNYCLANWNERDMNICLYSRLVLYSILGVMIIIFLLSFIIIPFVIFLMWLYFFVKQPETMYVDSVLVLFGFCEFVGLVLYSIGKLISWILDKTWNSGVIPWYKSRIKTVDKQPGFIRQAYDSFKNKYCMKVEFTNDNIKQKV